MTNRKKFKERNTPKNKKSHRFPMLRLEKAYSEADLSKFIKKDSEPNPSVSQIVLEPKIDITVAPGFAIEVKFFSLFLDPKTLKKTNSYFSWHSF